MSGEKVSAYDVEKLKKVQLVEVVKRLSTETKTEGLDKAGVKAVVLQLLGEKGMLNPVVKKQEMTESEFQFQMKKNGN